MFCEDSKLLIEYWEGYEAIQDAKLRLDDELKNLIHGIGQQLREQKWWDSDWDFVRQGNDQVYIASRKWQYEGENQIWIGVQGFRAEAIFGSAGHPELYVWVTQRYKVELIPRLHALLDSLASCAPGVLDKSKSGSYVVKQPLLSSGTVGTDDFDDAVPNEIIDFFSFYAGLRQQVTEVFRACQANSQ